jgi:hypothetical protein
VQVQQHEVDPALAQFPLGRDPGMGDARDAEPGHPLHVRAVRAGRDPFVLHHQHADHD